MADTEMTSLADTSAKPVYRAIPRGPLVAVSLLAGLAIAILWSAQLFDDDIGVNSANGILGHDSLTTSISGSAAGVLFAFTAGLAGSFTACNVAAFSAIAPLMEDAPSAATRLKLALRPLAWLAAGLILVAGSYGAIGATLGKSIPQLSTAMIGTMPERVLQSVIVFSVIGRPYPLFYKMFQYAASTHNGFYGALTFILVALGNIVIMALLFLALSMSRFQNWLRAEPGRVAKFTASALLIGGAFTFLYWGVRVPAGVGYGWFPQMPWH